MSGSSLNALASGLIPVLVMLLLGFVAGRSHDFDADQTSGFSSLVVGYTLPATPFVAIVKTPRSVLINDWKLLLLIAVTFCVTMAVGYVVARKVFHRTSAEAAIAALLVGSPGVPFFGTTVLARCSGPAARSRWPWPLW